MMFHIHQAVKKEDFQRIIIANASALKLAYNENIPHLVAFGLSNLDTCKQTLRNFSSVAFTKMSISRKSMAFEIKFNTKKQLR